MFRALALGRRVDAELGRVRGQRRVKLLPLKRRMAPPDGAPPCKRVARWRDGHGQGSPVEVAEVNAEVTKNQRLHGTRSVATQISRDASHRHVTTASTIAASTVFTSTVVASAIVAVVTSAIGKKDVAEKGFEAPFAIAIAATVIVVIIIVITVVIIVVSGAAHTRPHGR
ncbi:unnamed protein product [Lampetra fluviatilis]